MHARGMFYLTGPTKSFSLRLLLLVCLLFAAEAAHADTIYVATDMGSDGEILKIDSSGHTSVFASGLSSPTGLAFDSIGNLYVANLGNNTIDKFTADGTESVFASYALNSPIGLAFDATGNLYVASEGNSLIVRFDSGGNPSLFSSREPEPAGLAFDRNGTLYVANWGNSIDKLDTNGNKSTFASGLSLPVGLAFDSTGNLVVANLGNDTLVRFDTNGVGSVITSVGPRRFSGPCAVAFDESNDLFVLNNGDGTLDEFESNGNVGVIAYGLGTPTAIAIQIPEPSTWIMVVLGSSVLLACRRFDHKSS